MIPYAGKNRGGSPGIDRVAVISLQSLNKTLNKELYTLRSEKILVERELLRARARIEGFDEPSPVVLVGIEDVIHATASYYGLSDETLRGHCRLREVMIARHVAMYLASGLSRTSTVVIGRHLGGRDHTTVGSGIRRIQRIIQHDPGLLQDITQIKLKLQEHTTASRAVVSAAGPSTDPPATLGSAAL